MKTTTKEKLIEELSSIFGNDIANEIFAKCGERHWILPHIDRISYSIYYEDFEKWFRNKYGHFRRKEIMPDRFDYFT